MIYVKVDKNNKASLIHYKPFDEKHGLNKTQEELEKEGILFKEIPEKPKRLSGKKLSLYVHPLRWEYEDRPLTQEEKLQAFVDEGQISQAEMDFILKS